MNEEQQRIAIAEFCGWTFPQEPGFELHWAIGPDGVERSPGPVELSTIGRFVPNFLHDLNAIHEAESKLEKAHASKCLEYSDNLKKVINPSGPVGEFRLIHATAAQRAEALLKTIGKWKD